MSGYQDFICCLINQKISHPNSLSFDVLLSFQYYLIHVKCDPHLEARKKFQETEGSTAEVDKGKSPDKHDEDDKVIDKDWKYCVYCEEKFDKPSVSEIHSICTLQQALSHDLETGCPILPTSNLLGILFFKGEHNVFRLQT